MEAPMTRYIRVDYTVKPNVDLDNLKAAMTEFVAGIRSYHPEHRYTSFQHPADPNRFIHVGEVVEEVLPDLQRQPFFQRLTEYLPGQCSAGPEVTRLDRVASTAAQPAAQTMGRETDT
jgi:quinol monooxygenase YgiN